MKEWQAKTLLSDPKFAIPVQRFKVISGQTIASVDGCAQWPVQVVKAQCLAGGRGRGHFLKSPELKGVVVLEHANAKELRSTVRKMLGDRLVTAQTGAGGVLIDEVMVAEGVPALEKEAYLAVALDRARRSAVLMASSSGGMGIEEADDLLVEPFPLGQGPDAAQLERICSALGLYGPKGTEQLQAMVMGLVSVFSASEATLIEVNPLARLSDGTLLAVDAKISIDENALFRATHPAVKQAIAREEEEQARCGAQGYISLDGKDRSIGCLVNGAGLAMATMDLLGEHAANFLDIGGGASPQTIRQALETLARDPRVKVAMVNVFGGIVRCDLVAQGIIGALGSAGNVKLPPLVVRMAGTNHAVGLEMLENVKGVISACSDFERSVDIAKRVALWQPAAGLRAEADCAKVLLTS